MDYGHEQAEKALKKLEKRLNKEYTQAAKEVEKKLKDHLRKYEAKDHKMADKVKSGEMSEKDYLQWRAGQMAMGDRWKKLRDELVETYQDTNKVATDMIQDHTHQVYADNFNFGTFEVEKGSNVDTSFTLYSKDTVARLVKDNPKLLPPPNNKVSQAIKEGKAKRWNQQKVQSVMTQGILQGESIPKIAKRLSVAVGEMNMHSAIRNARTMTTSAENAGRIDSYKRAQDMGIEVKKQWLATLDGRTRHSHRILDGESVGIDEKFSNGLMFPADPDGAPAEVYNCRCTLIADIAGFSDNIDDLSLRRTGEGFTDYETWKDAHEEATVEHRLEDIISGTGKVTIEEASEDWFEYENANMMSEYIRTGNMPTEDMYGQTVSDEDRKRLIYDANLIQEVGAKTNTKQKTLYRGMVMDEDEVRALTPNDTYTMRTLTATTPDRKLANVYMDVENSGIENGVPVIFEIQKPDGIFGFKRDELETVLPKGSSFKVVRNYMDEDGVVHVSLYAKKGKNNVIEDEKQILHKVVNGKNISNTWHRREDKFDFEIEDIINAQGFDGLPRVVGAKEFDRAVANSNFIAQRTYSASSQEILDGYREQLYSGKWYVDCSTGGAAYGRGMYSVYNNGTTITEYMEREMNGYRARRGIEYNYIDTFTLAPDAKTITPNEIIELRRTSQERLNEEFKKRGGWSNPEAIKWASEHDMSHLDDGAFAALLGYDAILASEIDNYAIILNRTKCIFKRS